ncbi:MAG: hypothetical protein WA393_11750 [Nitrososphaeraceae archaeon]
MPLSLDKFKADDMIGFKSFLSVLGFLFLNFTPTNHHPSTNLKSVRAIETILGRLIYLRVYIDQGSANPLPILMNRRRVCCNSGIRAYHKMLVSTDK